MAVQEHLLPTDEDIRFFEENGYWLGPKVISDERLEELRSAMDRCWAGDFVTGHTPWSTSWLPGDDPLALRKMDNAHWCDPVLNDLATDETVGAIAARLAHASSIRLWHDQLLYKPGGGKASGHVGWHQDYFYWQCSDRPNMLTAWVAFDDVNVANGCMMVVPRSHKWGMMPESDFFDTRIDNIEDKIRAPAGEKIEIVPCLLKAGHVSFHHCLTIHGSGPNTTDRPRRSLVVHMMDGECRFKAESPSNEHMNVKLLGECKDGREFDGARFPFLYGKVFRRDATV
jgi:ectoine hydroxylase-related dioxygenase (phytanoyl-CoA dioxygenase family)